MFPQAFHDLSKPRVMAIIEAIKSSRGLSVRELSHDLEMSYMGVKQHCVKLEDLGYLKTWRVPREEAGRPEMVYRLTAKCDILFPQVGAEISLYIMDSVKEIYGDSAPEKLLYRYFSDLGERWKKSVVKGHSLIEKVTRLVDKRKDSGYFCRCVYTTKEGLSLEEYHHPLQEILNKYPSAIQVELQLIQRLLGTSVTREVRVIDKTMSIVVYSMQTL